MPYPAGSRVSITYSTDWLGKTTVYVDFDVLTSDTDAYIAMAAELDAQPDLTATWTGTIIDHEPEAPATTSQIDGFEVATLPVPGTYRTSTLAYGVEGLAVATPTFGAGTDKGVIAGVTDTNAEVLAVSEGFGTADLAFEPLSGVGAGPSVYDGWVGNFPGDTLRFEPLDADGAIGSAIPTIGLGECIMPPLNASAVGLTGEVSTSSLCTMNVMLAMGSSESEYAQGIGWLSPLGASGSDDPPISDIDAGVADLYITFSLDAWGNERIPNGANLRVRNAFQVEAYGGGQGTMNFRLALEASATGQNIGKFYGEIGYA